MGPTGQRTVSFATDPAMATTALFVGVVVSTLPKPLIQTDKTNFPADNLDALPSWDIANLQKATILLLPKHELGTPIIRVLIWQTEEFKGEDKAFRVDSALLWAKFTNLSGRKQRALMDLYLHPGSQTWLTDEGLDPMWHPIRFFDHAPNNKEVYEFLRYWHFTPADSKLCWARSESKLGEK